MKNKTISREDYEKAIETLNKYRIENIGFYVQMCVENDTCQFFDDLRDLTRAIYLCAAEGKNVVDCF